jgi:hypothetical protein
MVNRPTVGEHTLNLLFIIDFLKFNGCIPQVTDEEYLRIKGWLQYHDVEETVVGDIPYHFAKFVDEESEAVRQTIASRFIESYTLTPKEYTVAKIVDITDFILTMKDEPTRTQDTYSNTRVQKVLKNGYDVLHSLIHKAVTSYECPVNLDGIV